MNNYGTPPLALVRGRGRRGLGRRRPALPGPGRRHRGERARPRAPGRRRGGQHASSPRSGTCRTCTWPRRRSSWPRSCRSCSTPPARVLFCNSGAEAERGRVQDGAPDRAAEHHRRRERLPRAHHGRARAHRPAAQADAVRADDARRAARALRRRRRAGRGRSTPTPRRCSWSRSSARPARSPRRRATWPGPARSPPPAARCWCSTRCRPASGAPAPGSRSSAPACVPDVVTLAKGLGGGLPDRGLHRHRAGRGAARARPARHHVRRQPGLLRGRARGAAHDRRRGAARPRHAGRQGDRRRRRGAGSPAGPAASTGPACCSGSGSPSRSRRCHGRCPRRRVPDQQRGARTGSGWSRRWCSPRRRPTEFLAALPSFLDAGQVADASS